MTLADIERWLVKAMVDAPVCEGCGLAQIAFPDAKLRAIDQATSDIDGCSGCLTALSTAVLACLRAIAREPGGAEALAAALALAAAVTPSVCVARGVLLRRADRRGRGGDAPMIADGIATCVYQQALGFSTLGHSYRADIWQRHDGKFCLSILVLDPPSDDCTDTRRKHWTGRYAVVVPSQPTAFDAMASIVARLQARECLPCGSPLLNEEIEETRGIACYSCDDQRQANGGRWPT